MTAAQQAEITQAVARVSERRQNITLVCGMLMLAYGIDSATAFNVIVWRSQQTNVKLKVLADQLLADLTALPREPGRAPDVSAIDQLILTVHERVTSPGRDAHG